jgi:hypothetical protein
MPNKIEKATIVEHSCLKFVDFHHDVSFGSI